ncbi:phage major capsid protein, P2 family [Bordetella genomosp. 9]|uniref:Phage major capsid protein, P2 family n=1 Tax=Bordetella genomosp. 9 TaxID=1416803 RepID=A0A261RFD5_9BORD|nr:phage major capsid protein, P2 family [Bordetella genomosp. 9]OZI23033.1 phage major capsid protein, P2 family [Bordetella genomosp. 9]
MRNTTRKLYNAYLSQVAALNGVENATQSFSVEPSVQQTMETKIQESSSFLQRINMPLVQDQKGEKIGLGVSGPAASRTNTDAKDRQTRDLTAMDSNGYECVQTNFDTHIKYAQLDQWARFPDFQIRVRNNIIQRQALDRIMIGFNGVSVAADTDIGTNPLLQDVNKGWLQKLRERAAERVLNAGAGGGTVKIGKGGDYRDIDAAVYDLRMLLEPWYQDDTQLVAIVGRGLMHDKYFPLINQSGDAATEKLAADIIVSQKRIGGLPAVTVPFMPEGRVLITRLDNLSIYIQEGARRRYVKEKPERNRVEFYESSNDDYVMEDYGCAALLENVELVTDEDAGGGA